MEATLIPTRPEAAERTVEKETATSLPYTPRRAPALSLVDGPAALYDAAPLGQNPVADVIAAVTTRGNVPEFAHLQRVRAICDLFRRMSSDVHPLVLGLDEWLALNAREVA